MNDTPQGDGNVSINSFFKAKSNIIRINDTPQGDGNLRTNYGVYL